MRLTREQVEAMRAALEQLPEPGGATASTSRSAALRSLAPLIRDQRKKGYSLRDIAAALEATGVPCTYAAVKNAVAPRKVRRRSSDAQEHAAGPHAVHQRDQRGTGPGQPKEEQQYHFPPSPGQVAGGIGPAIRGPFVRRPDSDEI